MEGRPTIKALIGALNRLAKLRESSGNWTDSEIVRPEIETQVYKRLNAISCFVMSTALI